MVIPPPPLLQKFYIWPKPGFLPGARAGRAPGVSELRTRLSSRPGRAGLGKQANACGLEARAARLRAPPGGRKAPNGRGDEASPGGPKRP